MTYAHFEDIDELVISNRVGSQPEELADFVLGSVVHSHILDMRKRKFHRQHSNPSFKSNSELVSLTHQKSGEVEREFDLEEDLSPVEVHTRALDILRSTIALIERNQQALQRGVEMTHLLTPEIMKRYGSTQQRSERLQMD